MWLNVIKVRLNMRQRWSAVSTTCHMWGSLGLKEGFSNNILQRFRRSQSFCLHCL